MKIPTPDQWNSLPAGTYALLTLRDSGQTLAVLKAEEEVLVAVGDTRLCGPNAWGALLERIHTLELGYTPGGMPDFGLAPTLSLQELTGILEGYPSGCGLRMRVDGHLAAPGRPFHHRGTDREISLHVAAMSITAGAFLEQLAECEFLDREPDTALEINPDLPVRIRDWNRLDDNNDAWSITGVHQEDDFLYLTLE